MKLKGIFIVFKKEIKDLFRDRKTIIVGVLVPLLIFPIMYGFMGRSMENETKKVNENLKMAIVDNGQSSLGLFLKSQKNIRIVECKDPKKDIQDGKVYIAVIIPQDLEKFIIEGKTSEVVLMYDDTSQNSTSSYSMIYSLIDDYSKEIVKQRLVQKGIDISILNPVSIKENVVSKEKGGTGKFILTMMLPLFLIIYAISSPMAAAIDLGAGEKERGTLEPLLTTQVGRMCLLLGKMFAITVIGLVGTTASMIGLAFSFRVSGNMFGGASLMLTPVAYLLVGLSALLLTMIFGAVELSISIYARSFKEAQTYVSPLTILGMVAAFGTYMMDVKDVSIVYFNIPIANMSLIMKEFILGIFNPLHIVITFGWMIIYLVVVMLFARYMFTREEVIFRT